MENHQEENERIFTYTLKQRMVLDMFLIYIKEYHLDIHSFKNSEALQTKIFSQIKNSIYSFMNGYQIYNVLKDSQYDNHDIQKIVGISKDYIMMIAYQFCRLLQEGVDIEGIIHTLPRRLEIKNLIKEGGLSDKEIADKFGVSKQYINNVRTTFELSYLDDIKAAVEKGMTDAEIVHTYKVRMDFVQRVRMIPMILDSYSRMNMYASDNMERLKSLYPNVNMKFLDKIL